ADRHGLPGRPVRLVAPAPLPGRLREVGLATAALGVVPVRRLVLVLPGPPAGGGRLPDPGRGPGLARADQVRAPDDGDDRDLPGYLPGLRALHLRRDDAERPAREATPLADLAIVLGLLNSGSFRPHATVDRAAADVIPAIPVIHHPTGRAAVLLVA